MDSDMKLDGLGVVVPKVRVELTRGCPHRFLRPARLPFRHLGSRSILYVNSLIYHPDYRLPEATLGSERRDDGLTLGADRDAIEPGVRAEDFRDDH